MFGGGSGGTGKEGLLLTFFVYACGLGKPLDGRAILILCGQELQMLVRLARAATVAAFRREKHYIGYSLSQASRTHSCKRRIDAFPPCALRRVVDTPERGRLGATGTSDFGILQAQASDASQFICLICPVRRDRDLMIVRTFGNQEEMLLDDRIFIQLEKSGARANQSVDSVNLVGGKAWRRTTTTCIVVY